MPYILPVFKRKLETVFSLCLQFISVGGGGLTVDKSGIASCLGLFGLLKQTIIDWIIKYRNLFLTVLEVGNQQTGCQDGLVLKRPRFLVAERHFLVSSYSRQSAGELSGVPFMRALTPF